jgi:4-aminobutyrate aminotransferase-like enzyme
MTTVGVAAGTFAAANNKRLREIGLLDEEEILMPAVTGVLFKWPLIRQIRGRGYGTGMEAMSDKTRAMYGTEDALVARSRLVTTRFE